MVKQQKKSNLGEYTLGDLLVFLAPHSIESPTLRTLVKFTLYPVEANKTTTSGTGSTFGIEPYLCLRITTNYIHLGTIKKKHGGLQQNYWLPSGLSAETTWRLQLTSPHVASPSLKSPKIRIPNFLGLKWAQAARPSGKHMAAGGQCTEARANLRFVVPSLPRA